eukprot:TRINITY_DN22263_c0_g1_i1.p1 TRINITY_DN22263_c0_g1~~TRINITY_DN22263_c0_g1_i1.p1  ORF type:complete len:113 (+),score=1.52 TRINITY_DN22263_c0_g1_i1:80-418(+)
MGIPVWIPAAVYGGVAGATGGVAIAVSMVGISLLTQGEDEPDTDLQIRKGANCTPANLALYPSCIGCVSGCACGAITAASAADALPALGTSVGGIAGCTAVSVVLASQQSPP